MKYALTQRALHWAVALMVIGALAVGLMLGNLGFDGVKQAFGIDATNALYKYHKTVGVLILGLMALRVAAKSRHGRPDYAPPLTPFEMKASAAMHGLLYFLLFAMPATGWLATGASGYPVEFFSWRLPPVLAKDKALGETLYMLHGVFGWALLVLVVGHIGAALRHALIKRDGVLSRML